MPTIKRSLYQCYSAKVKGDSIFCDCGHNIHGRSLLSIEDLAKGRPLEPTVCQTCPDYNRMGPPIPSHQRGWRERNEVKGDTMLASDLVLSTRTSNTLRRAQILTVKDILNTDPRVLLDLRNFGKGCLANLIDALAKEGIDYASGLLSDEK